MKNARKWLNALKAHYNCSTDKVLAAILGVSLAAIRGWVIRDAIPAKVILYVRDELGYRVVVR